MSRDLGVWTADDCALVLIDYQPEMAKAFDVPIVLSTVGVRYGFNGPTLPSIQSEVGVAEAEKLAAAGQPAQ